MAKGPSLSKGIKSGALTKGTKKGKGGFVNSPAQMLSKKGKC
jgi:hypothetical protein